MVRNLSNQNLDKNLFFLWKEILKSLEHYQLFQTWSLLHLWQRQDARTRMKIMLEKSFLASTLQMNEQKWTEDVPPQIQLYLFPHPFTCIPIFGPWPKFERCIQTIAFDLLLRNMGYLPLRKYSISNIDCAHSLGWWHLR